MSTGCSNLQTTNQLLLTTDFCIFITGRNYRKIDPVSFFTTSPNAYRYEKIKDICKWPSDDIVKPVVIGNDVWIGSNVVILQGCKVGDGAVVAAGAVVTHNVEPYTVVGGVPAKKIKDRFTSDLKKKLQDSQWWNHEKNWIADFFHIIYNEVKNEKLNA